MATMQLHAWSFVRPGEPMAWGEREERPGADDVIVEVAGCGICHTDLGFYYEGVPTRHELPLTLGHEVSGTVVEAGDSASSWVGRRVIVPAVIPCGRCRACEDGRPGICPKQVFPGNDVHGGFATHLRVPATGLCSVPDLDDARSNPHGLQLATLSVIADAVSTAYQAFVRTNAQRGDLAVFVGAGGVGGFGAQIAAAKGLSVVAIDTDAARLEQMSQHGVDLALSAKELDFRGIRDAVRKFAREREVPTWRQFVFETSGTPAGQSTAFGLLGHGGHLSVVGYTAAKIELRLSNLMAFDATARGTWGCSPALYPEVLSMVLQGDIALAPFVEYRPLSSLNETLAAIRDHQVGKRVVLVPQAQG